MNKISSKEFEQRVRMNIHQKIDHAVGTIEKFYNTFNGKVYVSFSGGKDSTVLLWIARMIFPDVKGVFSDTGLEYPEIRDFVKTIENIIWVKPEFHFKKVLEKYGYPVISKMQSQYIEQYRTGSEKMKNIRWYGVDYGYGPQYKISGEWRFMINAPFKISDKCCEHMKKKPLRDYEKNTGEKPIIGIMATESSQRKKQYLQDGCNAFHHANPSSRPLSFFTENDIWAIIKKYKIPYSAIYDLGYKRTGCMFCLYGVHLNNPNHFQIMAKTHPKQYNYCMEKLGIKAVLQYMKQPYSKINGTQLKMDI